MNKTGYICLFVTAAVGLLVVALLVRSQKPVYNLKDHDPAMRAAAVRSLSGEKNKQSLIEALNDPDTDVRLLAIERLGGSGRNGAEALAHLLNDDHAGVRREAAWSLGHI
jgi:HEAT repeat protein